MPPEDPAARTYFMIAGRLNTVAIVPGVVVL